MSIFDQIMNNGPSVSSAPETEGLSIFESIMKKEEEHLQSLNYEELRKHFSPYLYENEEDEIEDLNKSQSFFGDIRRLVESGATQLTDAGGYVIEKTGAESIGQWIQEKSNERNEKLLAELTPEMQEAMQKRFTEDTEGNLAFGDAWTDPRSYAALLGQSAAGTVGGLGVGALFTKALRWGVVAHRSKNVVDKTTKVLKELTEKQKKVTAAIGYGAGEGAIVGPQAGMEMVRTIREADYTELAELEPFQDAYASTDPSLSEEERLELAREKTAFSAFLDVGNKSGLAAVVLGMPSGIALDRVMTGVSSIVGKKAGEKAGKKLRDNLLTMSVLEALQEAPQEASETLFTNLGTRKYVDPDQDTYEGVLESAVGGAIAGAAMGGAMGAGAEIFATATEPSRKAEKLVRGREVADNIARLYVLDDLAKTGKISKDQMKELKSIMKIIPSSRSLLIRKATDEAKKKYPTEVPSPADVVIEAKETAKAVVPETGNETLDETNRVKLETEIIRKNVEKEAGQQTEQVDPIQEAEEVAKLETLTDEQLIKEKDKEQARAKSLASSLEKGPNERVENALSLISSRINDIDRILTTRKTTSEASDTRTTDNEPVTTEGTTVPASDLLAVDALTPAQEPQEAQPIPTPSSTKKIDSNSTAEPVTTQSIESDKPIVTNVDDGKIKEITVGNKKVQGRQINVTQGDTTSTFSIVKQGDNWTAYDSNDVEVTTPNKSQPNIIKQIVDNARGKEQVIPTESTPQAELIEPDTEPIKQSEKRLAVSITVENNGTGKLSEKQIGNRTIKGRTIFVTVGDQQTNYVITKEGTDFTIYDLEGSEVTREKTQKGAIANLETIVNGPSLSSIGQTELDATPSMPSQESDIQEAITTNEVREEIDEGVEEETVDEVDEVDSVIQENLDNTNISELANALEEANIELSDAKTPLERKRAEAKIRNIREKITRESNKAIGEILETPNSVDAVTEELFADLGFEEARKLINDGLVRIAETHEGTGEAIKDGDAILGYYKDGVITLVAPNIAVGKVANVFRHEAVHRIMASDPLIVDNVKILMRNFLALKGQSKGVDAAFKLAEEKAPSTEGLDAEGLRDRRHKINEEALAYFMMNDDNYNQGIVKAFIAKIKAWLFKHDIPVNIYSEADFVALVNASIKRTIKNNYKPLKVSKMMANSPVNQEAIALERLINNLEKNLDKSRGKGKEIALEKIKEAKALLANLRANDTRTEDIYGGSTINLQDKLAALETKEDATSLLDDSSSDTTPSKKVLTTSKQKQIRKDGEKKKSRSIFPWMRPLFQNIYNASPDAFIANNVFLEQLVMDGAAYLDKTSGVYYVHEYNATPHIGQVLGTNAIYVNVPRAKEAYQKGNLGHIVEIEYLDNRDPDMQAKKEYYNKNAPFFGVPYYEVFPSLQEYIEFIVRYEKAHIFYKDYANKNKGEKPYYEVRATAAALTPVQHQKLWQTSQRYRQYISAAFRGTINKLDKSPNLSAKDMYQLAESYYPLYEESDTKGGGTEADRRRIFLEENIKDAIKQERALFNLTDAKRQEVEEDILEDQRSFNQIFFADQNQYDAISDVARALFHRDLEASSVSRLNAAEVTELLSSRGIKLEGRNAAINISSIKESINLELYKRSLAIKQIEEGRSVAQTFMYDPKDKAYTDLVKETARNVDVDWNAFNIIKDKKPDITEEEYQKIRNEIIQRNYNALQLFYTRLNKHKALAKNVNAAWSVDFQKDVKKDLLNGYLTKQDIKELWNLELEEGTLQDIVTGKKMNTIADGIIFELFGYIDKLNIRSLIAWIESKEGKVDYWTAYPSNALMELADYSFDSQTEEEASYIIDTPDQELYSAILQVIDKNPSIGITHRGLIKEAIKDAYAFAEEFKNSFLVPLGRDNLVGVDKIKSVMGDTIAERYNIDGEVSSLLLDRIIGVFQQGHLDERIYAGQYTFRAFQDKGDLKVKVEDINALYEQTRYVSSFKAPKKNENVHNSKIYKDTRKKLDDLESKDITELSPRDLKKHLIEVQQTKKQLGVLLAYGNFVNQARNRGIANANYKPLFNALKSLALEKQSRLSDKARLEAKGLFDIKLSEIVDYMSQSVSEYNKRMGDIGSYKSTNPIFQGRIADENFRKLNRQAQEQLVFEMLEATNILYEIWDKKSFSQAELGASEVVSMLSELGAMHGYDSLEELRNDIDHIESIKKYRSLGNIRLKPVEYGSEKWGKRQSDKDFGNTIEKVATFFYADEIANALELAEDSGVIDQVVMDLFTSYRNHPAFTLDTKKKWNELSSSERSEVKESFKAEMQNLFDKAYPKIKGEVDYKAQTKFENLYYVFIRTELASQLFSKNNIVDPEFFVDLAKGEKEIDKGIKKRKVKDILHLNELELFEIYMDSGYNAIKFTRNYQKKINEALSLEVDLLMKKGQLLAEEITYTEDKAKEAAKEIAELTLKNDPKLHSRNDLIPSVDSYIENMTNVLFSKNFDLSDVSIANAKTAYGLDVAPSDIFEDHRSLPNSEYLSQVKSELPFSVDQIGAFRNLDAEESFQVFAEGLGSELVVISDSSISSQWLPSFGGSPSRVVINVQKEVNTGLILGQQAFYHAYRQMNGGQQRVLSDFLKGFAAERFSAEFLSKQAPVSVDPMMVDEPKISNTEENVKENNQKYFNDRVRHIYNSHVSMDETTANIIAMSEIASPMIVNKTFHDGLSKRMQGKNISTSLVNEFMVNVGIAQMLHQREGSYNYEVSKLLGDQTLDVAAQFIAEVVLDEKAANAVSSETSSSPDRMYAKLGQSASEELFGALNKGLSVGGIKAQGIWKSIFGGAKNYKDVMTNIEHIIRQIPYLVKVAKPKFMFADFMADPVDTKLAHMVIHGAVGPMTQAQENIKNKFKDVYDGMSDADLKVLHDRIVRGLKIVDGKAVQVGGLDFREQEDIDIALEEDIPQEIIDTFKYYQEVSDSIYEELIKIYPDLPYRPNHYGQSMKWMSNKTGLQLNQDVDAVLFPDSSKLEGKKQYLEEKNIEKTTQELEKQFDASPSFVNPHDIFIQYVHDTAVLLNIRKMADAAVASERAILTTDTLDALRKGFHAIDDTAFNLVQNIVPANSYRLIKNGTVYRENDQEVVYPSIEQALQIVGDYEKIGEIYFDTNGNVYEIEDGESKVFAGYGVYNTKGKLQKLFATREAADAYSDRYDDYYVDTKYVDGGVDATVARFYFSSDLTNMLRNALSKDHFRNARIGKMTGAKLINLKHHSVSIEFLFNLFHFWTIGMDMLTSEMSFRQMKAQSKWDKLKTLNIPSMVLSSLRDSRDLNVMIDMFYKDPTIMTNESFQKRLKEIFKTENNVNLQMMIDHAVNVGWFKDGQDPALRGDYFKLGEMKYTDGAKGYLNDADELVIKSALRGKGFLGGTSHVIKNIIESVTEVHKKELLNSGSQFKAGWNAFRFGAFEATSNWLMEKTTPRIKTAVFMKEFHHELEKYAEQIKAGTMLPEHLAHMRMKFTEDRLGEANWKSQHNHKALNSGLIFSYRSFTWWSGIYKSLGKAFIDIGKKGWYTVKGDQYTLTVEGLWFINAIYAHMAIAALMNVAYWIAAGFDEDEVPTDTDVDLMSRLIFPRVNPKNTYERITIPSYITELNKIMHHVGILGDNFEPTRLVTGRFNSIISNAFEAFNGQDFRGMTVRDKEANVIIQGTQALTHIMKITPISYSSLMKDVDVKGFRSEKFALAIMGMIDAPAYSMRSPATNYAFNISRGRYSSSIDKEDLELSNETKRAAYQYAQGNRKPLYNLLSSGEIGKRQFDRAIESLPLVNGRQNPKYKSPLEVVLKRLSVEEATKVWTRMTEDEQKSLRFEMIKKYRNALKDKQKSRKDKEEAREAMREVGFRV